MPIYFILAYRLIGGIGIFVSCCYLAGNTFIKSNLAYEEVARGIHSLWSLIGLFASMLIMALGYIIEQLAAIREQLTKNRF